mmetsp:Transcript_52805/g.104908  ORF Transcript_52805/g.104908 Transcript_52805/m.104908 type:complete len:1404 (-) Transcript_52805:478-4689(-)
MQRLGKSATSTLSNASAGVTNIVREKQLESVEDMVAKYDKDGDGNFSAGEVRSIVEDVLKEKKEKRTMTKMAFMLVSLVCMAILGNAGLTTAIVLLSKDVSVKNGKMIDPTTGEVLKVASSDITMDSENKGSLVNPKTNKVVKTAQSHEEQELDSRLPDHVWAELEHVFFKNDKGGMLNLHVQATSRTFSMMNDFEKPLFGTYIRIQTAVGSIWLDGNIVTFEDGMGGIFKAAGFRVADPTGLTGLIDPTSSGTARRLSEVFYLMGVFNAIPEFEGWDPTFPLPRFPMTFMATIKSMHSCIDGEVDKCEQLGVDAAHTISYKPAGATAPQVYAFSTLKVWADSSKALVREQATLPGMHGWTYESLTETSRKMKHEAQIWDTTGEAYFCQSNFTSEAAMPFRSLTQDDRDAASINEMTGAFMGEEVVDGRRILKFEIKHKQFYGWRVDYHVAVPSSDSADSTTLDGNITNTASMEVHPYFFQLSMGVPKADPMESKIRRMAYLFESFTPSQTISDSVFEVVPSSVSSTSLDMCVSEDGLEEGDVRSAGYSPSARIASMSPFQIFAQGPMYSKLHFGLSTNPALDKASWLMLQQEMDLLPGGVHLAAILSKLDFSSFWLGWYVHQVRSNGTLEVPYVVNQTAIDNLIVLGVLVHHEAASQALNQSVVRRGNEFMAQMAQLVPSPTNLAAHLHQYATWYIMDRYRASDFDESLLDGWLGAFARGVVRPVEGGFQVYTYKSPNTDVRRRLRAGADDWVSRLLRRMASDSSYSLSVPVQPSVPVQRQPAVSHSFAPPSELVGTTNHSWQTRMLSGDHTCSDTQSVDFAYPLWGDMPAALDGMLGAGVSVSISTPKGCKYSIMVDSDGMKWPTSWSWLSLSGSGGIQVECNFDNGGSCQAGTCIQLTLGLELPFCDGCPTFMDGSISYCRNAGVQWCWGDEQECRPSTQEEVDDTMEDVNEVFESAASAFDWGDWGRRQLFLDNSASGNTESSARDEESSAARASSGLTRRLNNPYGMQTCWTSEAESNKRYFSSETNQFTGSLNAGVCPAFCAEATATVYMTEYSGEHAHWCMHERPAAPKPSGIRATAKIKVCAALICWDIYPESEVYPNFQEPKPKPPCMWNPCFWWSSTTFPFCDCESKSCFSGKTLLMGHHGLAPIGSFKVGDEVMTSKGFSPIYLITHEAPDAVATFVKLAVCADSPSHVHSRVLSTLSLTPQHYLLAGGAYRYAADVQVGMQVSLLDAEASVVDGVICGKDVGVAPDGLFNPLTVAGDVVTFSSRSSNVGVVASVWSEHWAEGILPAHVIPYVYQAQFAPVRMLYATAYGKRALKAFGRKILRTDGKAIDEDGILALAAHAMSALANPDDLDPVYSSFGYCVMVAFVVPTLLVAMVAMPLAHSGAGSAALLK